MITVTLPYPVSANRYWASRIVTPRGGKPFVSTYVTAEAKQYKESVAWLIKARGIRNPMPGRVQLDILMYPHRPLDFKKRMRDLGDDWDTTVQRIDADNCIKVVADSLKDLAFGDDKCISRVTCEVMEPDGREACVIVTIRPYVRAGRAEQLPLLPPVPQSVTVRLIDESLPF